MEEDNNMDEGFDEMNHEEMEGEEEGEDNINHENNDYQQEEGEEMISQNEQINNKQDIGMKYQQNENNQNVFNNAHGEQLYQQYPNQNDIEQKKENEFYQENDNNNINNGQIITEQNAQSSGNLEEINQKKLKQLKEEIENITDSDIDDPKYTPYNNKNVEQNINVNENNIQNIQNMQNMTNNNDLLTLQSKLLYLEQNNNFINKSLHDLEVENSFLKSEINKKNNIIKSKEDLNKEYQNLLSVFKDKLSQSEN